MERLLYYMGISLVSWPSHNTPETKHTRLIYLCFSSPDLITKYLSSQKPLSQSSSNLQHVSWNKSTTCLLEQIYNMSGTNLQHVSWNKSTTCLLEQILFLKVRITIMERKRKQTDSPTASPVKTRTALWL
jgi:hypothetical protein